MKPKSFVLIGILIGLFASSTRGETPAMPQHLFLRIAAEAVGRSFYVRLENGRLIYTAFTEGRRQDATIVPTAAQWIKFRKELDAIRVWRWKGRYQAKVPVFDGIEWSLDIQYEDRRKASRGENGFPTAKGGTADIQTATFNRYLVALRDLLGGKDVEPLEQPPR